MASQLLYTSAPRLLEAGRTGFGTVARHRAVSGLLVASVERASQFARLSGLSARRVVLSHRIIHAGAASYHVLSCIRDAGSDYTGRTNHLAHHLIADAREARAAAEAGITPADVLKQMRWLTTWNEAPRFFEPSEEISLTSFRASPGSGAWQRVTGNAANALLPAQAQRCLMLLPGEDGALDLFQESLQTIGGTAAWLVSFTTHLEPTDDLAELRWLALSHSSPIRQQVEGAVRTTFDLTAPESLPTPKLPELKPAPIASPSTNVLRTAPSPHQATTAIPSSPLPPIFAEPTERHRRSPWPMIAIALVIAAAGIGAFVFLPKLPSVRPSSAESAISLAKSVDDLWQKHRLNLPETKSWLKAEADEALVDAHHEALKQIIAAIREPLSPTEISMPPRTQNDFIDLVTHFRSWQRAVQQGVRDPQWSGDDPHEVQTAALIAISRMKEAWSKVVFAFRGVPEMPDVLATEIYTQVLKHLSSSTAPKQGTPNQWLDLLDLTRTSSSPQVGWIHHWNFVSTITAPPTASERAKLEELTKMPDAPVWFRQLTQKRLDAAATPTITAPAPAAPMATPAPVKPDEPVMAADGPKSTHPRFIIVESLILPLAKALDAMPTLPVEADMQVFIGSAGVAESQLTRWKQLGAGGVYRKSFNDALTLEFSQHRLAKLPDPNVATRIIARNASGNSVLFEVIILPKAAALIDAWAPSSDFTFKDRHEGSRTLLDAAASRWLQTFIIPGSTSLRLQHVDDPTRRFRLKNEGNNVLVETDTAASASNEANKSKLNALDVEIESLRQGIRIDEQRRGDLASGNLAKQQKEDSIRRLEDSLAVRQQRLLQLEEDRKAIAPDSPQFLGLPRGMYSLFAGLRRICEIKIESSK
jgi:hypothetical protein